MGYTNDLQFTRRLLAALHIPSCVLTEPETNIPAAVDLGLRSMLYNTENYISILENSLKDARDRVIYCFVDEHDCKYIFMRLPDGAYYFIGPYLMDYPDYGYVEKRAQRLKLSNTKKKQLAQYYTELPIIEDENWLLTLANALAGSLWGSEDQYDMEYVTYEIRDRSTPIPVSELERDPFESKLSLTALEGNYESEKRLMEAVSKGKLNLVTAVAASVFNNGAEPRLTDSLRDRKNNLVILKTLLRKAAEYGGVHPLHIHRLSAVYAQRIEKTRTVKESLQLQEDMIRDYCLLVKKHSLSRYSYYVGKAITLIHYDLAANLTLGAISAQINVNSSYLSRLFHRECGCTLTEYVIRQRLEHAASMLRYGGKMIQDIAGECGFQDATYFIRVFKRHYGVTPTVYRDQYN